MAHLALVHGINNHDRFPSKIENVWWQNILEGWRKHGFGETPRKPRIAVVYYAQRLYASGVGRPFLTDAPDGELPPLDLDTLIVMGTKGLDTTGRGVQNAGYACRTCQQSAFACDARLAANAPLYPARHGSAAFDVSAPTGRKMGKCGQ